MFSAETSADWSLMLLFYFLHIVGLGLGRDAHNEKGSRHADSIQLFISASLSRAKVSTHC